MTPSDGYDYVVDGCNMTTWATTGRGAGGGADTGCAVR